MDQHPKPKPPTRQPFTFVGYFTIARCCGCDWMIAGYGVSRAYGLWEEHADVDGCTSFDMSVQTQPEWML